MCNRAVLHESRCRRMNILPEKRSKIGRESSAQAGSTDSQAPASFSGATPPARKHTTDSQDAPRWLRDDLLERSSGGTRQRVMRWHPRDSVPVVSGCFAPETPTGRTETRPMLDVHKRHSAKTPKPSVFVGTTRHDERGQLGSFGSGISVFGFLPRPPAIRRRTQRR